MKVIYCCGSHGNVGWVKGWSTDEFHPDTVVKVMLTLDHRSARRFGRSDDDVRDLGRVLDYVMAYDFTFGNPEVFLEEEP